MTDWQERISTNTAPTVTVEHNLRYKFAAPVIQTSQLWCDLGCGNGIGAKAALNNSGPEQILLTDYCDSALAAAAINLAEHTPSTLKLDLAAPEQLEKLRESLLKTGHPGSKCITAFEVFEHLKSFVPVLELMLDLTGAHDFTAILSVPNDSLWSMQNPHHQTVWSGSALAELRTLLPADHHIIHQYPLHGSCIQPLSSEETLTPATHQLGFTAQFAPEPSHFLVAWGPRAKELRGVADVVQTDQLEQRAWERSRESDLAYYKWCANELAKYRTYIADLEQKLEPFSAATPTENTAAE